MATNFSNVLGEDTLKKFGVVQSGNMQGVKHIYYDTTTYTSASTTSLEFFNTTRSSNSLNLYTNFTQDGKITPSEAFIVTGISIAFGNPIWVHASTSARTSAILDGESTYGTYWLLLFHGNLEFHMAYKQYGAFPLWRMGGGGGIYGGASEAVATTATTTTMDQITSWANHGVPSTSDIYEIVYAIPGGVNFYAKMNWGSAQTLIADTLIKLMLDGWLMRPVG